MLNGGATRTPTDLDKVDIDEDGRGGDIEDLDNAARDARPEHIDAETVRLTDLNDQIAATFTDDELDAATGGAAIAVQDESGESTSWSVDGDLVDNIRERRDQVATERPEFVPDYAVADAAAPAGAEGASAAPAAVLAAAPKSPQPCDGCWQAAERVAPPEGQGFQEHWMNTWSENSSREHGVPNEQFVGVDQAIVIPGYTREAMLATLAPEPDGYGSILRFELALDPGTSTTSYGSQMPAAIQDYEFATWLYMQGRYADSIEAVDRWVEAQA